MPNAIEVDIQDFRYPERNNFSLSNVQFSVPQGSIYSIIGPSGSGKSTIMNIIAGLEGVQKGKIYFDDELFNSSAGMTTPKEIVLVFQDCARSLLPWLTARENLSWALSNSPDSPDQRNQRINEVLCEVGLEDLKNHFPREISGGQKQRLALGRALIHKPSILLLDEPFNALDVFNRKELENLLLRIWKKYKITIVIITHEIDEAIYLSQKILLIKLGRLVEDIDIPSGKTSEGHHSEDIRHQIIRKYQE